MRDNYLPLPKDARIYSKGGTQYPSVTTILTGVSPINYPENKLRQYAARGSIVDAQAKYFLKTGKWEIDPLKIPTIREDIAKMEQNLRIIALGSLKLRWQDCNFLGFLEKFGKDFKPHGPVENDTLFNDEYIYAGHLDWNCLYKDEPAITDFKACKSFTSSKVIKFKKQMAAYAKCKKDIKALVIIPLNPSNKCGYGAPIVERDIDGYFNQFIEDRFIFSEVYGY